MHYLACAYIRPLLIMSNICVWCVILLHQIILGQCYLHEYVKYYETLNYDKDQLLRNHHRLRRSQIRQDEDVLKLSFSAFDKVFHLHLKPDSQHTNFELVVDGIPYPKRSAVHSYYYIGHDVNDPAVYVHGSLAFGVFDGTIHDRDETYNIEPADRYYDKDTVSNHSVIYRQSDLIKQTNGGSSSLSFCGVDILSKRSELGEPHLHTRQDATRDPSKTRCQLNIVADYFFYKAVTDKDSNEGTRVAQATATVKNIVLAGSTNFERTDFDKDDYPDNITFAISKLTVETSVESSQIPDEFIGVDALLKEFSERDYEDYCLSYLFTYRDFEGGVLGLAFVAELNSRGGVCGKKRGSGLDKVTTYNTGLVSLLNYGRRVTRLVSQLTFTHEAGHNFGSQHDAGECVNSDGNNYVMFASAADGKRSNNNKFSQCSVDQIFTILKDRAQSSDDSVGCLRQADDNCGNQLVDPGEFCDCGFGSDVIDATTGACKNDPCCNGTTCMLAESVECSPQQGPCCDESCRLIPASPEYLCSESTDCAYNQTCNGSTAFCPKAVPIEPKENENGIICNDGSNYCVDGECTGSICIPLKLPDCECTETDYQCHVCCQVDDTCVSTIVLSNNDTARELLPNGKGSVLGVGFPCNELRGYCDFFNVCRLVDSEGALERITDFIKGTGVIQSTASYIERYWWAGAVAAVGILFVSFLIVIGCHFCLPRPKHMINRAERRRQVRHRARGRNN